VAGRFVADSDAAVLALGLILHDSTRRRLEL